MLVSGGRSVSAAVMLFQSEDSMASFIDRIKFFFAGGPKSKEAIANDQVKSLTARADAMISAKLTALDHAAFLEKAIADTRSDLDKAIGKLMPNPPPSA